MSDTTDTTDTTELEAAFNALLGWIKGGRVSATLGLEPYAWERSGWAGQIMSTSPAGPFAFIHGPKFVAYLREQRRGVGYMGRIDLRAEVTPEKLLELGRVARLGSLAVDRDEPAAPTAATVYPWREGALGCWSIIAMHHYYHPGCDQHLTVVMERFGKLIKAEGPDGPEVWRDLLRQAEMASRSG